jgi:hypothetical protein
MSLMPEPIEGKVVELKRVTVAELIEKLLTFDPSMPVITWHSDYGVVHEIEVTEYTFDGYDTGYQMKEMGVQLGDKAVLIGD